MKREELEKHCTTMRGWYFADDADSVMDAMEQRIKELVKAKRDILTRNVELIGENAQLTMKIKELEAEVDMDAKKRRIMIDGYNRKCERVKELEEQCTKYQAELMNNDPALNDMPKWISVKDRLPKYSVEVLIVDDENNMYVMWRDRNNQGDCWSNWEYSLPKDRITHWQPLPPPPSIVDSSAIEKEK